MIALEQVRWQPLGTGRMAPQGSIGDRALADRGTPDVELPV